jgi:hypothetical protein
MKNKINRIKNIIINNNFMDLTLAIQIPSQYVYDEIVKWTCKKNYIDALKILLNDERVEFIDKALLLRTACVYGHLNIIKYIYETYCMSSDNTNIIYSDDVDDNYFDDANVSGDNNNNPDSDSNCDDDNYFDDANVSGDNNNNPDSDSNCDDDNNINSNSNSDTSIFSDIFCMSFLDHIFKTACSHNQFEIAKWTASVHEGIDDEMNKSYLFDICSSGNVEFARWFVELFTNFDLEDCAKDIIQAACLIGNLELLTYLVDRFIFIGDNNNYNLENAIYHAYTNNHEFIVLWLVNKLGEISDDTWLFIFKMACINTNIDLAKHLLKINTNINNVWVFAFESACAHAHINLAKYLLEINPGVNINQFDDIIFRNICCNCSNSKGNVSTEFINVVKWLCKPKFKINICTNNNDAFVYLCKLIDSEPAKYLYQIKPSVNIRAIYDALFNFCSVGNLDGIQFLHEINSVYDVDTIITAFYESLIKGHSSIYEWMYKHYPDYVTNQTSKNIPQNQLSYMGNISVISIKWFIKINPNFDLAYNNDSLFEECLVNENIELLSWLITSGRYISIDNMYHCLKLAHSDKNFSVVKLLIDNRNKVGEFSDREINALLTSYYVKGNYYEANYLLSVYPNIVTDLSKINSKNYNYSYDEYIFIKISLKRSIGPLILCEKNVKKILYYNYKFIKYIHPKNIPSYLSDKRFYLTKSAVSK